MAEDMGERTEQPTGRRLSEARQRGQIAKSTDLAAAIDLIGATVLLALLGGMIVESLGSLLRRVLEDGPGAMAAGATPGVLKLCLMNGAWALGPALAAIAVISLTGQMVQTGWLWTTDPLKPKLAKLNPVNGVGKLFNRRNFVKTVVNSLKLAAVGWVAWLFIGGSLPELVRLPALGVAQGLYAIALLAVKMLAWLLTLLLVIGLVDWTYQRWQHRQDLRMTKQEVKDEQRNMEGDPAVRGRRLRMMREIAMQRINQAVPTADVIIANPTHFSVAIRYDAETMRAPRVVAKGADMLAMRIRQLATMHGVPIVERPPLARALYAGVEEGREIAPEFYQAVAEILAYVYRLESRAA